MQKGELKKNWQITSDAFQRFLGWLDGGEDSDGRKYLEMRQRLVNYFDRKNCPTAETLADETLNRVMRRLEEEGKIESDTPAKFCYITAKFVFLEYLRDADHKNVSLNNISEIPKAVADESAEKQIKEQTLECLDQCVQQLEDTNRKIITGYYFGEERVKIENRRELAQSLGISTNALTIRACRIRDKLEACVKKCAGIE